MHSPLSSFLASPESLASPGVQFVRAARRITKDALIQRLKKAGHLRTVRQIIAGLDDDTRFEWESSAWFSVDNPIIAQGIAQIPGIDPAVILAEDPDAPAAPLVPAPPAPVVQDEPAQDAPAV
jgi:hypothetical protein